MYILYMYHPISIQSLSKGQISKMLKGNPVRVKSGSGMNFNASKEQMKKIEKAMKKGSGTTIMLDPFQQNEMSGSGIKSAFKKLGSFVKGNKEAFRPLARSLKESGNELIAQAAMKALDEGVDPSFVSAYTNMSIQALNPKQGQGFIKKLNKFVKTPAVKTVRKALRPIGQAMFNTAQDLAMQGLEQAAEQAMGGMTGMGGSYPSRGRGGALRPAGYDRGDGFMDKISMHRGNGFMDKFQCIESFKDFF